LEASPWDFSPLSDCFFSPTFFPYGLGDIYNSMDDNVHQWRSYVLTFLVVMYELIISYLALVLLSYVDLLDVLRLIHMHVVKYASTYIMLISIIKLT
jgi:hypothetical protein